MLREYHVQIMQEALGETFSPRALEIIIAANLRQDDFLIGQVGHPEYHFDHNCFVESDAYIKEQREIILQTLKGDNEITLAWEAFGRLTHTAQDFYAHSNYVRMWLSKYSKDAPPLPEEIAALDEELLNHPELHSGKIYVLEVLSYLPFLRPLVMRLLPEDSHAHMNLDYSAKGPSFPYAIEAAVKRTVHEYMFISRLIETNDLKLDTFTGKF